MTLPPTLEPPEVRENVAKEPGVYVRSAMPDDDLDVLWGRERRRHSDHSKSHIGFFFGGLAVGAVVTFATCFFLFSDAIMSDVNKPIISTEDVLSPKDLSLPTSKPVVKVKEPAKVKPIEDTNLAIPLVQTKPMVKEEATASIKGQTYEVSSGDTLGSIANKFYHSVDPSYIERIQKANRMSSPDALQIGQKLIIPPKNY